MDKQWTIYNTHTGIKVRDYQYAEEKTTFRSIEQLHNGFQLWRKLPLKERQEKLLKMVLICERDKDNLASVISQEMGKPFESAQAEVRKCIESSKYLCQMDLSFLEPKTIPNPTYTESTVTTEPFGVILSILPWNFPAWQGFRAFFPTLLAGNTVLVKHSEVTPTVGDLLQSYFEQAGLSEILQHQLFSHEITEKIIGHPFIGGASITGSVKAGQIISKLCSQHFKKCVLELGGSDPSLVLEDCNLDQASRTIARARLQNAGQVCISAKRALVPQSRLTEFKQKITEAFTEILEGKPAVVGPLSEVRFKHEYNKTVAELKKISKLIFEKDMSVLNLNEQTAFVNPCILLFEKNHEVLQTTEVFGPCLIVIPYDSVEEAIYVANSTIFGLGASVYGNNLEACQSVASQLQAGQVSINDFVKSDVRLPFGGYKMSGLGRESGHEGFFEFTQTRVISVKK